MGRMPLDMSAIDRQRPAKDRQAGWPRAEEEYPARRPCDMEQTSRPCRSRDGAGRESAPEHLAFAADPLRPDERLARHLPARRRRHHGGRSGAHAGERLWVQACGDCHLHNFGTFATPEGTPIFDINDFDETLPAPFEWDLKRLATSFMLEAKSRGLSSTRRPPARAHRRTRLSRAHAVAGRCCHHSSCGAPRST